MLLYAIARTCSLAPHILLEYVGAPFDVRLLDRDRGENKTQAYRTISPRGKVPALVLGDEIVLENVAIQMYIADRFKDHALAPIDLFQRARWMAALAWMSNTVHPHFRQYRRPEQYAADEAARPGVSAAGRAAFIDSLQDLDRRLEGRRWLLGEDFSTADVYAHVFHTWGVGADFPVGSLTNLRRHGQAMLAIPATRRAYEREGIETDLFA